MKKRSRKIIILFLVSYVLLWALTWDVGVRSVEEDCERRYVNLSSVSSYSPFPFLINVDFHFDHPLGYGEVNSWFFWAFGYCRVLHERPGVHAQKL